MPQADDVDLIVPGVFVWRAYDASIKTELCSSAFAADAGIYIVDPVLLAQDALEEIVATEKIAGVIVTNANHLRAAREFSDRFAAKIWKRDENSSAPPKIDNEIQVVAIDGAAPGEIALCVRDTLIVGDALINFEPYGFTFLPPKYCANAKEMRRSLGQLLQLKFERILFAHGDPMTKNAHERLARLFEDAA